MNVQAYRHIKNFEQIITSPSGEVSSRTIEYKLPERATSESAGIDLQSPIAFTLDPGKRTVVDTGIVAKAPRNFCFLLLPRSGLAAKHGVTIMNSPGLIDRDFCGSGDTLKVILVNHGEESVEFKAGDRIAQLMLTAVTQIDWVDMPEASFAKDGNRGGLGSTGL